MIHNFCFNLHVIFPYNRLCCSYLLSSVRKIKHCINSLAQTCDPVILKEPLVFQQHHTHSLRSNYTAAIQWKRSNIHFQILQFLQLVPACCNTYFAEHGPYDAWPVALQQALLIDRVMTNQVFNHKQEGSNTVSLQSTLWEKKNRAKELLRFPVLPTVIFMHHKTSWLTLSYFRMSHQS